jgi:hypothetical protein
MAGLLLGRHHGQTVVIRTPAGPGRRILIVVEEEPSLRLRILADPDVEIARGEVEGQLPRQETVGEEGT